jgi:hypothetical protein
LAYSSCTQELGSGVFKYDWSAVRASKWISARKKWQVKIQGDGVDGKFFWYCDDKEDADGLVDYGRWVNQKQLFAQPAGSCDTDAPSASPAPSTSLMPTDTSAPKCDNPGLPPYLPARTSDYFDRGKSGTNGGRNRFKVEKGCKYMIDGDDVVDKKYYTEPEPWLKHAAELYDGTPEDSSGSLTGIQIPVDDIILEACGDKFCTVFLAGQGVAGGNLTWSFDTERYAKNF